VACRAIDPCPLVIRKPEDPIGPIGAALVILDDLSLKERTIMLGLDDLLLLYTDDLADDRTMPVFKRIAWLSKPVVSHPSSPPIYSPITTELPFLAPWYNKKVKNH